MASDHIENITKGVTKAVLDWTDEKIKNFVNQFKNRKIAFIQNSQTIEEVKKQKETSEYALFINYVADERLRLLFQMGLTLRKVEKNTQQWQHLRDRIYKKYGDEGLHIAKFVQNGSYNRYLTILMEKGLTPEQVSEEIKAFFVNIENTNSFIQSTDNVEKEVEKIVTRIYAHSPHTYIISGSKIEAIRKCKRVKDQVMSRITGYTVEFYKTDITEIYFLIKKSIL